MESPKFRLSEKLKICSTDFCLDCTGHGLANIVKTDSWILKICWLVLVSAGTAYSTYCNINIFVFLNLSLICI